MNTTWHICTYSLFQMNLQLKETYLYLCLNKHNIDPSLLKEHRPKFCSSSTEMVMSLCEKNILEQTENNIQLIIHSTVQKIHRQGSFKYFNYDVYKQPHIQKLQNRFHFVGLNLRTSFIQHTSMTSAHNEKPKLCITKCREPLLMYYQSIKFNNFSSTECQEIHFNKKWLPIQIKLISHDE